MKRKGRGYRRDRRWVLDTLYAIKRSMAIDGVKDVGIPSAEYYKILKHTPPCFRFWQTDSIVAHKEHMKVANGIIFPNGF